GPCANDGIQWRKLDLLLYTASNPVGLAPLGPERLSVTPRDDRGVASGSGAYAGGGHLGVEELDEPRPGDRICWHRGDLSRPDTRRQGHVARVMACHREHARLFAVDHGGAASTASCASCRLAEPDLGNSPPV